MCFALCTYIWYCNTHAHWLLSENALHASNLHLFCKHCVLPHSYLNHELETSLFMQIHAWVTAMSLKHKALASWTTNKVHPASALPTRSSKRLKGAAQSASDLSHHQSGKPEAKTPAKTSPGVSGSSQRHTATLALHANATSAATGLTFGIADGLLTAAAKFDVDDVCGVVAAGSTGPVYHARYIPCLLDRISMLHMQSPSCLRALILQTLCTIYC